MIKATGSLDLLQPAYKQKHKTIGRSAASAKDDRQCNRNHLVNLLSIFATQILEF